MATDAYRRMASLYDRVVEPAAAALRRKGLEVVPPRDGISILDVGCGTGTQLALYRRPGCRLAGVDLSPSMVAQARRKLGEDAEIRCENASATSFESASFDLVMIVTVLHELPRDARHPVLDECQRLVRPGGRILVMDYQTGPYPFPSGWAWKGVITFMELLAGREHFRSYRSFMRSGGLEPLIARTGMPVVTRYVPHSRTAAVLVLAPGPSAAPVARLPETRALAGSTA